MHDRRDLRRPWTTAPRPKATSEALAWLDRPRRRLRPLHRRRVDAAGRQEPSRSSTPPPAERSPRVAQAARRRCRRGGRRRRARRQPAWAALSGHARARYLYALARADPEALRACSPCSRRSTTASRSARRATSTSRWSRATSTTTPAGRSCMDTRVARHARRSASCGQIIPWNFPLLMLAWKIAPALAAGQHAWCSSRPSSRRSPRCSSPRSAAKAGAAAGRGQHRHRRRRDRRGDRQPSRHRQDRLHRLDRGRPHHPQGHRRHAARSCRSSWAASRPSSSSTTPISTAPSKAWSTRSGSTRARSAAPARACWCRRAIARALHRQAARAHGDAARRRPARQGDRHRRDRRAGAARAHPASWCEQGVEEGATLLAARRGPARPSGCFYPADAVHRRRSPPSTVAQVEIFGPVLVAMTFRTPGRGGGARQQHRATAWPPASGARTINLALDVAPKLKAGVVWINSHQPVRRRRRLRRLPRKRLRPRGRHARACASTSSRAG